MIALLLLALQDPVDDWIAKLGADDPAAREAAVVELVKLGSKARRKLEIASESRDPEVAGRAAAILRRIDADERRAKLASMLVKVDDHLAWVPRGAFELLKDRDAAPENVRTLFKGERPTLVLVRGNASEIIRPDLVASKTAPGHVVRRRVFLPVGVYNCSRILTEPVFEGIEDATIGEAIRCWPSWSDAFPILDLQDGFFVADGESNLEASLLAAASTAGASDAAWAALRNFFRRDVVEASKLGAKGSNAAKATFEHLTGSDEPDAWWETHKDDIDAALQARWRDVEKSWSWFEPLVDLLDPDADAKILKLLAHAEPRVRRDALDLAAARKLVSAAGAAVRLLQDKDWRVRVAAIDVLAAIGHPEGVIAALLDDPAPPVRVRVMRRLRGPSEKVLPFLADPDAGVRAAAAHYCARTGKGKDELRARLADETELDVQRAAALALVHAFGDEDGAALLIAWLEAGPDWEPEWSPEQLDALNALNRLRAPEAYAKLGAIKVDEKNSWDDAWKQVAERSGLSVVFDVKESEYARDFPGFDAPSDDRLPPLLPAALLATLQVASPQAAVILEPGAIKVVSARAAADFWSKWRKDR